MEIHNLGNTSLQVTGFLSLPAALILSLPRTLCPNKSLLRGKRSLIRCQEAYSIQTWFTTLGKYILVEKDALNNLSNVIKIVVNIIRIKVKFIMCPWLLLSNLSVKTSALIEGLRKIILSCLSQ